MADTFEDLGIAARLTAALARQGYERPTPLQTAAVPVLRRGGNVVMHASSGAGVTLAYGVGLLDRLLSDEAGAGLRALVLAPTAERGEAIAEVLSELADGELAVRTSGAGWRREDAVVLVATVEHALQAVQSSELKLEALEALVVADASEVYELGGGDALATLVTLVPRDTQRVIATGELTDDVAKFVEAHVRRPLSVPAREADPEPVRKAAAPAGQIGYVVLSDAEKPAMLARLLEGVQGAVTVYARTAARADRLLNSLRRRGVVDAAVHIEARAFHDVPAGAAAPERVLSYDVPFSAEDLQRVHATGGTVFVTPLELTHFRRIAEESNYTVKHRRARDVDSTELTGYRDMVRAALADEDISAQMLVLEPLLDAYSAMEIAAALSALLRRRSPARAAATAPSAVAGVAPRESTSGGLTRLFLSIGTRDNIRPGDIVGAITGEADIKGEQVGRVDIRESFSVVEVNADVAERVIRALNGTTMRGRSLRVDYDRKGSGGSGHGGAGEGRPRESARGGGPPRGPGRGPARGDASGPPRRPRQ